MMNKGILGKSVVAACAAFVILGSLDAGLAEASTPDVSTASAEVGVMAGGIKMLCVQDDQWGAACP
ncbi:MULTISPECIES: hypothetical protein [Streptomyces]|uniref:hypothetical protein n=1 Tax=Streptomyces TaxID=1883 RepID=UPI0021A6FBD7|nr:hypothetical protein [Streptomyces atratus]MCT2542307.1 hypothetical protein [Streptomyces atratus]